MSVQISANLELPINSDLEEKLREIPIQSRWHVTGQFIRAAEMATLENLSSFEKTSFAILYAATWNLIMNPSMPWSRMTELDLKKNNLQQTPYVVQAGGVYFVEGTVASGTETIKTRVSIKKIHDGITRMTKPVTEYGPFNPPHMVPPHNYRELTADEKRILAQADAIKSSIAPERFSQPRSDIVQRYRIPNRFDKPQPPPMPPKPKYGTDPRHPYPDYAFARRLDDE